MEHNDKVFITLDRPREMRFGHKEQKQLEAMFNQKIEDVDTRKMSSELIEQLMFTMLQRDALEHQETLRPEDMEDLLDYARPGVIREKLTECLIIAFAPTEAPDEPEAPKDPDDPIAAAH